MRPAPAHAALVTLCAGLVAVPFALRLSLLHTRAFDPDELQHLHGAWAVSRGMLPFRDFFEHHMPAFDHLLSWGLARSGTDAGVETMISFMFSARTLMWALAAISVALTVGLGARYGGQMVAWLSGAILSTSIVFVGRTLEIRPDVPALALWLSALLALVTAMEREHGKARVRFALAGALSGTAVVFNQKLLLAGPGLALLAIWWLWDAQRQQNMDSDALRARAALLDAAAYAGAGAVPLLILLSYYWTQGAMMALLHGAFIDNLGWPREASAASALLWLLLRDPFLAALGAGGLIATAAGLVAGTGTTHRSLVLLLPTASLLAGLWIIPTPFPQYLLPVLPVAAILGAASFWMALTGPVTSRGPRAPMVASFLVPTGLVLVAGFSIARPFFRHVLIYPLIGSMALVAAILFVRRRQPALAAAVVLTAASLYSAQQLVWMRGLPNTETLDGMRLVDASTEPTDRVLDGFSGLAWFRPHAFRYWFLHPGVQARLSPADVASVLTLVDACATRPRVVILDEHLRALSPDLAPAVAQFYRPSDMANIWLRDDSKACAAADSVAARPVANAIR